ncbi:MAG: hypothetical protein IH959_06635 [Chloroflexi bacterium]|nr:hypothetical protein [Chloroflexota bacterium]
MQTTIDRINQLSAERATLFSVASNGLRGDSRVQQQIAQIGSELESLWNVRRQERAGHLEGIDLLVDRSYRRLYGRDYDDAVAPPLVGPEEEHAAAIAA